MGRSPPHRRISFGFGRRRSSSIDSARPLILYDRTTLIARPIGEAEVIDADIVEAGAHRRGGRQRRSSAALTMCHDMIAWAEPHALHHRAQDRCGAHDAVVH